MDNVNILKSFKHFYKVFTFAKKTFFRYFFTRKKICFMLFYLHNNCKRIFPKRIPDLPNLRKVKMADLQILEHN